MRRHRLPRIDLHSHHSASQGQQLTPGELIGEGVVAVEMGATVRDLAECVHPHPTLSETIGMAAEAFEGTITDLYIPKKKMA